MAEILRVRVRFTGVLGGRPALGTFYWQADPGTTRAASALDAVNRVRAALAATATVFTNTLKADVLSAVDVLEDSTGALVGSESPAAPAQVTYSGSTDNLPAATQLLVRSETGVIVAGRRLRGRHFLPGPIEGGNAAGVPSGTGPATVATAFNGLLTGGTTSSLPVVWHRPGAGGAGLSAPVQGYSADSGRWSTLRSRRA